MSQNVPPRPGLSLNTENKKPIFDICSDYFDNVIGIKQKRLFF